MTADTSFKSDVFRSKSVVYGLVDGKFQYAIKRTAISTISLRALEKELRMPQVDWINAFARVQALVAFADQYTLCGASRRPIHPTIAR